MHTYKLNNITVTSNCNLYFSLIAVSDSEEPTRAADRLCGCPRWRRSSGTSGRCAESLNYLLKILKEKLL